MNLIIRIGLDAISRRQCFICLLLISASAIINGCGNGQKAVYDESGKPVWHVETTSVERLMPDHIRRVYKRSCAACHGLNGSGIAGVAPDLNRIPQRSPGDWEKYLRDPAGIHPSSAMPPVWITADEITAFAVYLANPADSDHKVDVESIKGDR